MSAKAPFTFEDEVEGVLRSRKVNEVVYKDLARLIRRLNYTFPAREEREKEKEGERDFLSLPTLTPIDLRKSELNDNFEHVPITIWPRLPSSPLFASKWTKSQDLTPQVSGYIKMTSPTSEKVVISLYSDNLDKMFVSLSSKVFRVCDSSRFFYGRFLPAVSDQSAGDIESVANEMREDEEILIGFSFEKRAQSFAFAEIVLEHTGHPLDVERSHPNYLAGDLSILGISEMSEESSEASWQPDEESLLYTLPNGW